MMYASWIEGVLVLGTIHVLDDGFVRLVRHMGDDSAIVQSARVSYGRGSKGPEADARLIDYLIRNNHSSPLESVVLVFHMRLPIFVARHLIRHRTSRVNEVSARYTEVKEGFYRPIEWKTQDDKNRQSSGYSLPSDRQELADSMMEEAYTTSYKAYNDLLQCGVSREQARIVLPVASYTEWYYQMDLNNLFKLFAARLDAHAQAETREYAKAMFYLAKKVAPIACESFFNNTLRGNDIVL